MKTATSVAVLLWTTAASAGELTHVTPIQAPPPGFAATLAAPRVNLQHFIPPEPDSLAHPRTHERWSRAVGAEHVVGKLSPGAVIHKPAIRHGTAQDQLSNWSGDVLTGITTSPQGQAVTATFQVPSVYHAHGACSPGYDYMSAWPGIDGFPGTAGGASVLQAGVDANAYCSGSSTSAQYYAWIEWYPAAPVTVSQPAIGPGDVVFVEVWSTSPTQAYATILNDSTGIAATYSITPPAGTTLHASSVEWVVERPALGANLTTLANYGAMSWLGGITWNFGGGVPTTYTMGADPGSGGTLHSVTMVDDVGKPISSATIETPTFLLL